MIGGRAKPEHREIEVVSYPTMTKTSKENEFSSCL